MKKVMVMDNGSRQKERETGMPAPFLVGPAAPPKREAAGASQQFVLGSI